MLSASVDRALVQAAAEVVVLADHTKLGTDTMFQTVPTDVITRLVTDEPPGHDDRAATELQALADQGVHISVAGPGAGSGPGVGGAAAHAEPVSPPRRRDVAPLPGQRRGHPPVDGRYPGPERGGPPPGGQLRGAVPLDGAQATARVADLAPRRR
ncbi:hypothetical protein GCM10020221_09150 [Streptomyces thioluteus]|uniref:DeoR-like transcriptional repressor C-terminal sensor domain-containing protein n=1 Tax=Streptomyces thioluteus TaxID=66431 RepID=A0ABN3WHC6_STRTU